MQMVKPGLYFSTEVTDSTDENDFKVEFMSSEEPTNASPIKVTSNFEELLSFLDEWEDQ